MADGWEAASESGSQDSTPGLLKKPQMNNETSLLKKQLSQCLKKINGIGRGHFAKAGTLPDAVNPGLHVRGLGLVGLPLSECEAVELEKACHQAPFGKGSETIIDTAVRNTRELNADQFELQNPAWQTTLDVAVKQVADALDIVGGKKNVRTELYKLLLYSEGAFFESHTDTEKSPGMFGTLVIALPSKHTGGDVQASFGGQSLTLGTAGTSDFGYSYLAWYSDVKHTVLPVTSGHRLVLTYNLLHTAGYQPQLASCLNDDQAKLKQVLALWDNKSQHERTNSPRFLAYMLDHKYTDANLQLDHLKGKDAVLARYLQAACHDQEFCFFLANLEYTKNGGCEETYDPDDDDDDDDETSSAGDEMGNSDAELGDYHGLEEIYDTSLTLRTLFRVNGQLLAKGIPIEDVDIVQDDPFDRAPDSEDYEGYTGNAGASATHTYRNSCIVIMPRQHQTPFLLGHAKKVAAERCWAQGDVDMEAWIGPRIGEVKSAPAGDHRRVDLAETCELIVTECKAMQQDSGRIALFRDQPSSLSDTAPAATAAKASLPIEVYQSFGEMLGEVDLAQWQQCLELALGRTLCVHQRWRAITNVLRARKAIRHGTSPPSSSNEALEYLLRQAIVDLLSTEVMVSKEDAQALVEMVGPYGQGFLFSKYVFLSLNETSNKSNSKDRILKYRTTNVEAHSILPFVKRHVSNTTFSITFLILLFESERAGATKDGVAKNIYRDVLADLIPSFKLEIDTPLSKRPKHHYYVGGSIESEQTETGSMNANDIASLIDHCRIMQLADENEAIMGQLVTLSKTVDPSAFKTLFIPLMTRLMELCRVNDIPLNMAFSTPYFQNVFDIYVQRYIGLEPAKPRDWALARTGCRCGDCHSLSKFLTDPREKVGRFAMVEKRRRHLENRLCGTGCTRDTERRGSPHTLVVTKTLKNWHESHKAWKARCETASQSFRTIGTEALKQIFGECYEEFIGLKAVRLDPAAQANSGPPSPPPMPTCGPPPPSSLNTRHAANTEKTIRRTPMAALSKSISRTVNAQQATRRERTMLDALSKSNRQLKNPDTPRQHPGSTSKIQIIDLTTD